MKTMDTKKRNTIIPRDAGLTTIPALCVLNAEIYIIKEMKLMANNGDPTADLLQMMDEAGLTGQLQATKGPLVVGITNVRTKLAKILVAYIAEERRRAFDAGVEQANNNKLSLGGHSG